MARKEAKRQEVLGLRNSNSQNSQIHGQVHNQVTQKQEFRQNYSMNHGVQHGVQYGSPNVIHSPHINSPHIISQNVQCNSVGDMNRTSTETYRKFKNHENNKK